MNLKSKIAFNISLLFSIFLGFILCVIYLFFSKYRKDEFVDILKDRIATVSNYFESNDEDNFNDLMKINNTPTYSIQKEKISVFDKNFKLIYSNIKDEKTLWKKSDLEILKKQGNIYRSAESAEIYGEKIDKNYYIIYAADYLGIQKLSYLGSLMLIAFILASSLIWVISFLFAKKMMSPLDLFQKKITRISANNLNERLPETNNKDEINLLAKVFNTMLSRIDQSYSSQKEFTASASHEIKTPLTRMAFQLENLAKIEKKNREASNYIKGISNEVFQLSDTVNSLLLLAQLEQEHLNDQFLKVRIDEVIFDAFEKVKVNFEDFEIEFEISEQSENGNLTVKGIKSLLEIVFINLFKNACLYSDLQQITVNIFENEKELKVEIKNTGKLISKVDTDKIFKAFKRGENAHKKNGSGLGLRICKRILDNHKAQIFYRQERPNTNIFSVIFPLG